MPLVQCIFDLLEEWLTNIKKHFIKQKGPRPQRKWHCFVFKPHPSCHKLSHVQCIFDHLEERFPANKESLITPCFLTMFSFYGHHYAAPTCMNILKQCPRKKDNFSYILLAFFFKSNCQGIHSLTFDTRHQIIAALENMLCSN